MHVSTNYSEEAKPWGDTCLVAKKEKLNNEINNGLEKRINNLEDKMDRILTYMENES